MEEGRRLIRRSGRGAEDSCPREIRAREDEEGRGGPGGVGLRAKTNIGRKTAALTRSGRVGRASPSSRLRSDPQIETRAKNGPTLCAAGRNEIVQGWLFSKFFEWGGYEIVVGGSTLIEVCDVFS